VPRIQDPASDLAGYAAAAPLGRPGVRGRLRSRLELLRQRRLRNHGAAVVQGSQRLGTDGLADGAGGSLARAEPRLREVPLHVPSLGPPTLRSGRTAVVLATLA